MATAQRAAAMPFLSLVGASPLRLFQHQRQRATLFQSGLQRRLLSGQPTARLGLLATAQSRAPFSFASHRTSAPLTAVLRHIFKSRYSTNSNLPTYFQPTPPPPKRSFIGRLFWFALRLIGVGFALFLGSTIGIAMRLKEFQYAGMGQKRYADEQVQLLREGKIEEYANFQEPGAAPRSPAQVEKTAEILHYILGHPYVREHLEVPAALDGWEIVDRAGRAPSRLPADFLFFHMLRFLRENNMFTSVLSGEHTMPVPPLTWRDGKGEELVLIVYTGKDLCGHENIVHGGFVATLLDEAMARCCFPALPGNVGVTAYLNIDYRAPTPANGYVVVKAKTTQAEGRKAWVEARVETLPPANSSEAPRLLAEAKAMFVTPKEFTTTGILLKKSVFEKNLGL